MILAKTTENGKYEKLEVSFNHLPSVASQGFAPSPMQTRKYFSSHSLRIERALALFQLLFPPTLADVM